MSSKAKTSDEIKSADCWSVLERAAASSSLKRAARLREFLFYVAGKSLKEGNKELHEQEIGHDVFGRDKDYDTSQDNIVRVNATELRKRIDSYFEGEGVDEPLIFGIPRGSYSPVFRWRTKDIEALETPLPKRLGLSHKNLPLLLVSLIALLLAISSALLWRDDQSLRKASDRWEGRPALAAFWSRFLNGRQGTDIVLADTSFALIEDISKQSFSLNDYVNRSFMHQVQSSNLSADRRADLDMIAVRSNGSMGDFRVAHQIWALDPASTGLILAYARDYSADSIKRDNVILIGSQKPNPWVDLFYSELAFTVEYNPSLDQSFIKNANPQAGEQSLYPVLATPDSVVGYGIIAYLPNSSHTADVLIIAGTNSQATNAAGEFVTSEASMERLLKKFPTKKIPYFEVLLRTTRLSGTPLGEEIVAVRNY
jgi:hypothetical protein